MVTENKTKLVVFARVQKIGRQNAHACYVLYPKKIRQLQGSPTTVKETFDLETGKLTIEPA